MRIVAILLAAGESRRMGADNKLLLPFGDTTVLRHAAQTLLASEVSEVVVVVGHEQAEARAALAGLPVKLVYNPDYQQGQMTSVHAGMNADFGPCDGVMICLTDQPLLTPDDINLLITGFAQRPAGSIVVPTWQGERGNPIVLAYEHRDTILAGEQNLGCRRLLDKQPQWIHRLEMPNAHVITDMDTPEAYQRITQQLTVSNAATTDRGVQAH